MSEKVAVHNPHDGSEITTLAYASDAEVQSALDTAYNLYKDCSQWLPAYERVAILERLLPLMEEKKEHLTQVALTEGGKPYADSLVEVNRAINGVKLGIQAFHQVRGTEIPLGITASSRERKAFTTMEPCGVVTSLSAFNHPLNLIVHQTIPAIVAGCPFIVKPAAVTPMSCFEFVGLLREAGLPKEWGQPIFCSNENAEKLATDKRTAFLSFIGSARVGWYLRSKLAPGAHCALEHGGAAPVVIDPSAQLSDDLIASIVRGAYYYAGQVCVSVQRIYVPTELEAEFTEKYVAKVKELKVGNPADKETTVGPLIRTSEVRRVGAWVEEAVSSGAKALTGGSAISERYYEPTVLLNPDDDQKVSTEEIFGPVSNIYTYSDLDEAIERANALPYCFQASVIAQDIDKAMNAVQKLKALAVMVNDHTAFRVDWMPFGGAETSGLGVGGIEYSVRDMTKEKLMVIKSPSFA